MRYGHSSVVDSLVRDGLWDVYNDIPMGACAEKTAEDLGIGRKCEAVAQFQAAGISSADPPLRHCCREQDAFAVESYRRAAEAARSGAFAWELAPVTVKSGRRGGSGGDAPPVSVDEEVSKVDLARVPSLRPVFKAQGGTITAANASSLSDGASALVLMSAARAQSLGVTPLAVIRGFGDAEQAPMDFPTSPAKAVPVALKVSGGHPLVPADADAAVPA